MLAQLKTDFNAIQPAVDFCSLRYVEEISEQLSVRQDVSEPPQTAFDRGAMITVMHKGGIGYAATSDLSRAGLAAAAERARYWAEQTAGRTVADYSKLVKPNIGKTPAQFSSKVVKPIAQLSKRDKMDLLMRESAQCKVDPRIVDWGAGLWTTQTHQLYLTADGGEIEQQFQYVVPSLHVTAFHEGETQIRSWGGRYNGFCQQGGMEILERAGFAGCGKLTAEEALQLLTAPNCPSGVMDVILMPDQMMLQIHESIGHPLELDRILGDERNFAGTSFVTLDMFGTYQYGSPLLNVTYDPTRSEQFASFGYDDDGLKAERQFIIKDGILQRPLGGAISQGRVAAEGRPMEGVATTRACSWNRAPIDRMSNLNVEAGSSSLDEMIASIDNGVLMKTNTSWSIDDSRNKFQFGCEYGQRIEKGKLTNVVKNPNYRGISATFWRSLSMVGGPDTVEVQGTPYCGKGEPNQVIRVGHASPACKFSNIDVFGGEG
ncbi:MAG: TldD/PmbA family protein [Betaproteobacteria bacterium]|nr:TldD/PmbA family protein [Betaproteobacteria bacterium]